MKKTLFLIPCLALGGCLAPATVPTVSYWLMESRDAAIVAKTPRYGTARLSQVVVSQPYAGERLVVLREDGTVAFDPFNVFAALPSSLLKDVYFFDLKVSGLFSDVLDATSLASASVSVEVIVKRLALDCRQAGSRQAVVQLIVRVMSGKSVSVTVEGAGSVDASDGDYGVAFSKAASTALGSALSKIR